MKQHLGPFTAWMLALAAVHCAAAGEPEKYTLRYKFHPGETLRWEVEHRTNVRTTVTKETIAAETLSLSVKRWKVKEVRTDGTAVFEHSVEWADMRNKTTGRNEVRYDSRKGAKPPPGFESVAKSIGVPMMFVTMDAQGKVLRRNRCVAKSQQSDSTAQEQIESWMTIPMPEKPVAIGQTWTLPLDIDIPIEKGGVKRIKAIQQFTLEDVKTGVAVIRVSTEILTPINDPAIESQLVQREAAGRVRFDIDAGRIISQQMDIDKHVVGFRGETSSIHYVNRFTERLLTE
jgi:hypothetical protein